MSHMFADMQHCWVHYVIRPCCQSGFQILAFVFK